VKKTRLVFAILVLCALAGSTTATECNTYPSVTVTYIPGFGYVCGGYGSNCTECFNLDSGKYCVRNGAHQCLPNLQYEPGGG
jgi:hypothetical protein